MTVQPTDMPTLPSVKFDPFPTLDELIKQVQLSDVPAHDTGLFEVVFNGRIEEMYYDSLDHPEKYTEEARNLFQTLLIESRKPTAVERDILNTAVHDYVLPPRVSPSVKPAPTNQTLAVQPPEISIPEPEVDASPGDLVSPYWWAQ